MAKRTTKKSVATKKTKSAKSGATPLEVLASFGREIPERLRVFFGSKEFASYENKFVWGISGHETEKKFALSWASPKLLTAYEDAEGLDGVELEHLLPFAHISKTDSFLVVKLTAPEAPVLLLELKGGCKPFAASFDEFLSRLLDKGEASPLGALKKASEKAQELVEKDAYKKVLSLLEPLLAKFPLGRAGLTHEDASEVGHACNLLGLAYKNLGDVPKAVALYERAGELGSKGAGLNLCDLYLEEFKDYEKLVSFAEELSRTIWAFADSYSWFHVRNYLGQGCLLTNRPTKAVFAYHQILEYFAEENPEKVNEAIQDLRTLLKENSQADKKTGEGILLWLDAPAQKPAKERGEFLRNWWATLPSEVQAGVRKKIEIADRPSDEELERVARMKSLSVQNAKLKELSWVAPFQQLEHLSLEENELTDLTPLEGLTRLERIYLSNNQLESLVPLAKLKRLTHVSAGENPLKSLYGVEHLQNLTNLHAPKCALTDVEPLRGLPELTEVTVYHNQIDDFSPLAECPRLEKLSCFGNPFSRGFAAFGAVSRLEMINAGSATPIDDIVALKKQNPWLEVDSHRGDTSKLPKPPRASFQTLLAWWRSLSPAFQARILPERKRQRHKIKDEPTEALLHELLDEKSLHLSEQPLGTLPSLEHYLRTTYVNLKAAEVSDLSALTPMPRLRELVVRGNPLRELTPLSLVKNLEELYFENCQCASLEPLRSCVHLRELQAEGNAIEDLAPLEELGELRELGLENNRIHSLAPLRALRKLRVLRLGYNQLTDLSPLASCENLRVLEVWANPPLGGVLALAELPELDRVVSHGSISAKDRAALQKAKPELRID